MELRQLQKDVILKIQVQTNVAIRQHSCPMETLNALCEWVTDYALCGFIIFTKITTQLLPAH